MTRLASPSDVGRLLKPYVFLDFVDYDGPEFMGELHPHSGIATVTYIVEGVIDYIDPDGRTGIFTAGGVEYMHAGRGMWRGGGVQSGRTLGFQLWIALPPELEHTPPTSIYVPPKRSRTMDPSACCSGPTVQLQARSPRPCRSPTSR
jgi:redox-sensitive bicupin YhaK (pirin superfamily)